MHQVELEIVYCIIPSLSHNSQNLLQERSGQVLYLTACKVSIQVVSELSVDCVNNTVVLTIASLKYTVPYIVKYTYSTVLTCMLV